MIYLAHGSDRSPIMTSLYRYRFVLLLAAIQAALGFYALSAAPGLPLGGFGAQVLQLATILPCAAYAVIAHRLFHLTYVERTPQRLGVLQAEIRSFLTDGPTILRGSLTLALLLAALAGFTQAKRLVAMLGEFSWDETFERLDRLVFLGHEPWRVFHGLIGWDWVLTGLTGAYAFWLTLLLCTLTIAAFTRKNPVARMQFMIAHLLSWLVIGIVMATLMSSAGPVYFADLGLGNVYQPLLETLDAHAETYPYSVRELQKVLWDLYTLPDGGFSVISAMPSMHVASTMVVTLYAFTASRALGWVLTAFTLVIFIGSFMLAWHYFLDGIVAMAAVGVIWQVSGWLARRSVPDHA